MEGTLTHKELKQHTGYPKGFGRAHGEGGKGTRSAAFLYYFVNIDLHCVYKIM